MALVTLTTDFGWPDPYVAAMKGVLCSECPGVHVADLTHDIAPHDVLEGALFLAGAASYFPPGTVHVAVVDPGVGTVRRPIAVLAGGQLFVCPDNGIVSLFVRDHPVVEARLIANPAFMRDSVSATFHGRDVFAPAAARLAGGTPLEEAGPPLQGEVVLLDVPLPEQDAEGDLRGVVIHVDRFGNAITNIPARLLVNRERTMVSVGDWPVGPVRTTYGDVEPGQPVALIGSAGRLEIAVREGNAAAERNLRRGDPVFVAVSAPSAARRRTT